MPKIVKQFQFCPRCGGKLRIMRGKRNDICSQCGYEVYDTVLSVATTIIVNGRGEILLTKRARAPHRGMWGTPGGFAERGESAEDTARRESREELGLRLNSMQLFGTYPLLYRYQGVLLACIESTFIARLAGNPRLLARDDISEAKFVKPEHIPYSRLAFPSQRVAIRKYLKEQRLLRR